MKLSQKRAISYAIRKRQLKRQNDYLIKNNLVQEFENSKYKSLTWFLKSKGVNIY